MNTKSQNMSRLGQLFFAAIFLLASKAAFANLTFHDYEITVSGGGKWFVGTYTGNSPNNSPGSAIYDGIVAQFLSRGFSEQDAAGFAQPSRLWGNNVTLATDFATALGGGGGTPNAGGFGPIFWTGISGTTRQGQAWDGSSVVGVNVPLSDSLVYAFVTPLPSTASPAPAPVPEIDGKMLPQVALLLGSLYLLFVFGRRTAGRVEPSGPALAQAV